MALPLIVECGDGAAQATDLCSWLHDGRLAGVQKVSQQEEPAKSGEQGPLLLPLLTVILASPAVVAVVKSVHRYIQARTPQTTITLKQGSKSLTIVCVNPPPIAELVEQAKTLFEE
ncbi:effector-associated constant component EACC1 [Paraburkholderia sp. MM6662-R1]|uniref:effector-associated constant component EACC1 n=1 Tax=Paraburkholderia sp. MM6662-R1 TaxID=2991066 RepID=UPI003D23B493